MQIFQILTKQSNISFMCGPALSLSSLQLHDSWDLHACHWYTVLGQMTPNHWRHLVN